MEKEKALEIAKNGAIYLSKQINDNGKFNYLRLQDGTVVKRYNMLRHCGCVWAMSEVASAIQELKYNSDYMSNLIFATKYIEYHIEKCGYSSFLLDHKMKWAKLGGNALAIIALQSIKDNHIVVELDKHSIEKIIESLIGGIFKEFIDNESFTIKKSKFNYVNKKNSEFVSEYYPGETALAFVLSGWSASSFYLIKKISETRDKESVLRDHWLMQALQELHPLIDSMHHKRFIVDYIGRIRKSIVDSNEYFGNVTAMACMSEGLISDYCITKNKYILEIVEKFLGIQSKSQVKDKDSPLYGAFVNNGKARIDFTQHNVSAFLRYALLQN